ncbi:MAG: hypothetical protein DIZ80_03100 [endosymbiont of Galathealinum brachiosum]|uniref:Uncharacterized protein n=1 Tax=endosymbiont of Galathealinum brachiosum TaxID=2200906 RepID=A0A370DHW8_9GAMM|nr:MAG: hypothetical protein DIZ80_03100 [endosymbiont of Galathealinum brachiosum]
MPKFDKWPPPVGCNNECTAGAALHMDIQILFDIDVQKSNQKDIMETMSTQDLKTQRDYIRYKHGSIKHGINTLNKLAQNKVNLEQNVTKNNHSKLTNEQQSEALNIRKKLKSKNGRLSDLSLNKKVASILDKKYNFDESLSYKSIERLHKSKK